MQHRAARIIRAALGRKKMSQWVMVDDPMALSIAFGEHQVPVQDGFAELTNEMLGVLEHRSDLTPVQKPTQKAAERVRRATRTDENDAEPNASMAKSDPDTGTAADVMPPTKKK